MIRLRIIALSLLAGATLAVGATAAIAFPAMKALDPTLATYAKWPDPHWPIAAGAIANTLFRALDWLALGVVLIAVITLIPRSSHQARSLTGLLCGLSILGLVAIVGVNWGYLRPTMHTHLDAYWTAAQSGDIDTGRAERSAFDRLHPVASYLLTSQLVLALVGAGLSRPMPLDRQQ